MCGGSAPVSQLTEGGWYAMLYVLYHAYGFTIYIGIHGKGYQVQEAGSAKRI